MADLSSWLLDVIARHADWSGPIIGLLAFLESLLIVGLFVPAIALMVAVGGLMGAGILDPAPIIVFTVVGAILGDWVSYAVGRRMGPAIYCQRWLRNHRIAFARARLFFRRYGFASVLLGRFLGPVRSTVPVVAGVLLMPHSRFQAANILSALLWVPALMAPGYFAGSRVATWGASIETIVPLAMALLLLPVAAGAVAIKLFSRPRHRDRALERRDKAERL